MRITPGTLLQFEVKHRSKKPNQLPKTDGTSNKWDRWVPRCFGKMSLFYIGEEPM